MSTVPPVAAPRRIPLSTRPIEAGSAIGWSDTAGPVRVDFLGRGGGAPRPPLAEVVRPLAAPGRSPSWLTQVHGCAVVEARAGHSGSGDALVSGRGDLALVVVTADCVPVLLAAGERIAAVHAGWRGIVAGVVPAAITRLAAGAAPVTAWVGPAIGVCCYEVGEEVASQVALAAGADGCVHGTPGARPHLDLRSAVEAQLVAAGVAEVRHLDLCTRCHPNWLWSFRREGPRAGRNLAWIARELAAGEAAAGRSPCG